MILDWKAFTLLKENLGLPIEKIRQRYMWYMYANAPRGGPSDDVSSVTPPVERTFVMTFIDINAANVSNIEDVSEWNSIYGLNFDSVTISGNTATFKGTQQQTLLSGWTQFFIPGFGDANTTGVYDYGGFVDSIDIQCFYLCTALASVLLPNITNIPDDAFYSTALTSFSADLVTSIGFSSFGGVTGACTYSFPNCTTLGDYAFNGSALITSVSIPQVTNIPYACFTGDASLTSVTAPLVTTVGFGGFEQCASLTSISLPSCIQVNARAFNQCSNLSIVDLPICEDILAPVQAQPTRTFGQCNNLTLLNIPSVLTIVTPGMDDVFDNVVLTSNLTINVNSIQQTIDGGNPDGDLVAISTANPGQVTINYV